MSQENEPSPLSRDNNIYVKPISVPAKEGRPEHVLVVAHRLYKTKTVYGASRWFTNDMRSGDYEFHARRAVDLMFRYPVLVCNPIATMYDPWFIQQVEKHGCQNAQYRGGKLWLPR